jgi:hypothetical protein
VVSGRRQARPGSGEQAILIGHQPDQQQAGDEHER